MSNLRQLASRNLPPLKLWQSGILQTPLSPEIERELNQNFTLDQFWRWGYLERSYLRKKFNYPFYQYMIANEKASHWLWPEILGDDSPELSKTQEVDPFSEEGFQIARRQDDTLTMDKYQQKLGIALRAILDNLAFLLENPGVVITGKKFSLVWDLYRLADNTIVYRYLMMVEKIYHSTEPIKRLRDFYDDIVTLLLTNKAYDYFDMEVQLPRSLDVVIQSFLKTVFPEDQDFQKVWQELYDQIAILIEPFELSVNPLNQDLAYVVRMVDSLIIITDRMIYFRGDEAFQVGKTFPPNRHRYQTVQWF